MDDENFDLYGVSILVRSMADVSGCYSSTEGFRCMSKQLADVDVGIMKVEPDGYKSPCLSQGDAGQSLNIVESLLYIVTSSMQTDSVTATIDFAWLPSVFPSILESFVQ